MHVVPFFYTKIYYDGRRYLIVLSLGEETVPAPADLELFITREGRSERVSELVVTLPLQVWLPGALHQVSLTDGAGWLKNRASRL